MEVIVPLCIHFTQFMQITHAVKHF